MGVLSRHLPFRHFLLPNREEESPPGGLSVLRRAPPTGCIIARESIWTVILSVAPMGYSGRISPLHGFKACPPLVGCTLNRMFSLMPIHINVQGAGTTHAPQLIAPSGRRLPQPYTCHSRESGTCAPQEQSSFFYVGACVAHAPKRYFNIQVYKPISTISIKHGRCAEIYCTVLYIARTPPGRWHTCSDKWNLIRHREGAERPYTCHAVGYFIEVLSRYLPFRHFLLPYRKTLF